MINARGGKEEDIFSLSPTERNIHDMLATAAGDDYCVLVKTAINGLPNDKYIDFLICDKKPIIPRLGVILGDTTPEYLNLGIPVVSLDKNAPLDPSEFSQKIKSILKKI
jgi:hypothetical protein